MRHAVGIAWPRAESSQQRCQTKTVELRNAQLLAPTEN